MKGGGVIASIGLLAIATILAIVGGGSKEGQTVQAPQIPPRFATAAELLAAEQKVGHRIYWAGPRRGTKVELSSKPGGDVLVRYLTPGVNAGAPDAEFLTVGTYPVPDAQAALRRAAQASGGKIGHVAGGGMTLVEPTSELSAYLAYPGADLQVEVYDPKPGSALKLIEAGAIEPVG